MTQAQLYPSWKEIVTYSANGPHHEILINTDAYKAVLVGLEASQKIAPHPASAATYHFLDGSGWMVVAGERLAVGPGATVTVPRGVSRGIEAETRLAFLGSHAAPTTKKPIRKPFVKVGLLALFGLILMYGLMVLLGLMTVRTSPITMMFSGGGGFGLEIWGVMLLPIAGLLIMLLMMFVFFRMIASSAGSMKGMLGHDGLMSRMMDYSHGAQLQSEKNNMTTLTYNIPSISCRHCKMRIQRTVGKLSGVAAVSVDVDTKQAVIKFGPPATGTAIEELLAEIGYPPEGHLLALRQSTQEEIQLS